MKTKVWVGGVLFAVAACATGCLDIIGYTERTLDSAGGGGTGGSGGTTGTGGAGGVTGGTGGAGGAPVCAPGDTQPCYDGAAGTENVGVCKGGTQTCDADGTGFGECIGEVTPSTEECSKLGNEACTGALGCSDPVFVKQFGDETGQAVSGMVRSKTTGDVFIAGQFNGAVKFGDKTLVGADFSDLFVAKLGAAGEPLWAFAFSGQDVQSIAGIDGTPDGGVVFLGRSAKPVDFGGGPTSGLLVVKLDTDGNHLWTKGCTTSAFQTVPVGLAADSKGDVLMVANSSSSIDCGSGPVSSAGARDVFLFKLSGADGSPVWSGKFGDSSDQTASAIAVDQGDNVLLGGAFAGTMALGVKNLTDTGGGDAFLVKRKADGSEAWAWQFGDPSGSQAITSIAVDSLAGAIVAGTFESSITVGNDVLTSNGGVDLFVGALSSGGQAKWARSVGDLGIADYPMRVAVDGSDDVLLTGVFQGALDLGGEPLDSGVSPDLFTAKLDPSGAHLWSKRWNATGAIYPGGIVASNSGAVIVAGSFTTAFDLGSAFQLTSAGDEDVFVGSFAP